MSVQHIIDATTVSLILAVAAFGIGVIRAFCRPDPDNRYERNNANQLAKERRVGSFQRWFRYGFGVFGKATIVLFGLTLILACVASAASARQNEQRWGHLSLVGFTATQQVDIQEWHNSCPLDQQSTLQQECQAGWQIISSKVDQSVLSADRAVAALPLVNGSDITSLQKQEFSHRTFLLVFQDRDGHLYQLSVGLDTWLSAQLGQSPLDFTNHKWGLITLQPYTPAGDSSPAVFVSKV